MLVMMKNGHDEHAHEMNEHAHDATTWKMFVIFITLFMLMMFDFFGGHSHSDEHGHSHEVSCEVNNGCELNEIEPEINSKSKGEYSLNSTSDKKSGDDRAKIKFFDLFKGTGLIVFLANLVHKCADGLVIGAAYSESLSLGLSTALAILFHEIPHELGDYGLLHTSGFKNWQIIILNSIGSCTAFCCFLVILALNPSKSVREWIFAVTAGLFIYISLAGMVPRIKLLFQRKNGKLQKFPIFLTIIGLLTGSIFMLLLSLYEEVIKVDFSHNCN